MPTTAIATVAVTCIGGPTALLEYAGLRILTDPTFDTPGSYEEPGSTTLVKTTAPAIARTDLPPIDLVLLSHHEHRDNLDWEGLELLATGVRTLSTAKAATDLFGGNVVGLDAWESFDVGDVTVTAVPALHGPPGTEHLVGPVIGFVLESAGWPRVYVSGDNASLPLVEQIAGSFGGAGIALLFAGAARCITCHSGAEYTDANSRLHAPITHPSEPEPNGEPSYASRSATGQYRAAPLRGLWQHAPYFHNGSAATLDDVVIKYDRKMGLGLTPSEVADLAQYLKSL